MSLLLDIFGLQEPAHDQKEGLNPCLIPQSLPYSPIPALFPDPCSASTYPTQILKPDLSILRTPLYPCTAKSNSNTKLRTLLFPLGNVRDSVTKQQLAKYVMAADSYANETKKIPKTGQKAKPIFNKRIYTL